MKLVECKWLSPIVTCQNYNKWNEYLEYIYNFFKVDFIDTKPIFDGKIVNFKKAPMDGKYEHAFIHLTHKDEFHNSSDPNSRIPDPRRTGVIGIVELYIWTCMLRKWQSLGLSVIKKGVEFEGKFSQDSVF